jgi:hypothetical protein
MGIKVVVGEAKPCSDLASRLAMVYNLLLCIAEKAGIEHRIGRQESSAVALAEAGEKADLDNQIAAPHDSP